MGKRLSIETHLTVEELEQRYRAARDAVARFEGVATLEKPRWVWFGKQSRQETVKRDLAAQAHEVNALRASCLSQSSSAAQKFRAL